MRDTNEEVNYVLILKGEKTIYENKDIALYHISDLYHSYNGKDKKYYKNIYEKIKMSDNTYSDGSIVKSTKYMTEDDYDNLPAIIVPAETLKGWNWHKYNDGSGSLHSPNGNKYMSYDLSTNEYKERDDSKYYDFFPLSYYYIDGEDPKTFKPFKYMEKVIKDKYYLKEKIIQFNTICKNIDFRDIDMCEPHLESISINNNTITLNCEKYSYDVEGYVSCEGYSSNDSILIQKFGRLDLENDFYVKKMINELEEFIDWEKVQDKLCEKEGDYLVDHYSEYMYKQILPADIENMTGLMTTQEYYERYPDEEISY